MGCESAGDPLAAGAGGVCCKSLHNSIHLFISHRVLLIPPKSKLCDFVIIRFNSDLIL